jgi:hypothetical protein
MEVVLEDREILVGVTRQVGLPQHGRAADHVADPPAVHELPVPGRIDVHVGIRPHRGGERLVLEEMQLVVGEEVVGAEAGPLLQDEDTKPARCQRAGRRPAACSAADDDRVEPARHRMSSGV